MMELRRIADFNADRVNFKGFGSSGTATAGQVTNIDYKLTEERLVYGGQLILDGHVFGDKVSMQVVDVDNILGYGAGLVLGSYVTDWYISPTEAAQHPLLVEYPTKIMANLYFRLAYTSVGQNNVGVRANIYCVKNIT